MTITIADFIAIAIGVVIGGMATWDIASRYFGLIQ